MSEATLPPQVKRTAGVTSKDIAYPRLKISHPSQDFVGNGEGEVPPFAIYSSLGREDEDRKVLFALPKGKDKPESPEQDGLLVYVLGLTPGVSANMRGGRNGTPVPKNTPGSEFWSWHADDPSAPSGENVFPSWTFTVYLPELENGADWPHRVLMERSSYGTARLICTYLKVAEDAGRPIESVPFRLWSEKREREIDGQKQRWGVFKAKPVAFDQDQLDVAVAMGELVAAAQQTPQFKQLPAAPASDEPAI